LEGKDGLSPISTIKLENSWSYSQLGWYRDIVVPTFTRRTAFFIFLSM